MRKTVKRISALTAALLLLLCLIAPLIPSENVFADGAGGCWTLVDTNVDKKDVGSAPEQTWRYKASELSHEYHYTLGDNLIKKRCSSSPAPGIIIPGESFTLSMTSELVELREVAVSADNKLSRNSQQWIGKSGAGKYGTDLNSAKIEMESTTGNVSIKYADSSVGTIEVSKGREVFTLTKTLSNTANYTSTPPLASS